MTVNTKKKSKKKYNIKISKKELYLQTKTGFGPFNSFSLFTHHEKHEKNNKEKEKNYFLRNGNQNHTQMSAE